MLSAATTEHAVSFPLLPALIIVPALGAVLLGLIPRGRTELHRLTALLVSVATGALSLYALADFDSGVAGFQFEVDHSWISDFGISWHFGLDGISLFLVVLTGLLFPLTIVAVTPEHDPKPYYTWLLVLMAGCMGVFTALDLFVFFVMFEIVLVPMYFLIGGWGHGRRVYAALKFFLFTMFGSALMLVGIVALAFLHQSGLEDRNQAAAEQLQAEVQAELEGEIAGGGEVSQERIDEFTTQLEELGAEVPIDFDLVAIAEAQAVVDDDAGANPFDWSGARWIFLAFALAFAVKVPLVPVHTWLPDAHTEAPTAGSVILAGVMLKLGTYGFIRYGLYLFPGPVVYFAPTFVTLGVIGIIYGAITAAMQKDLKRLVAYSSVAHLGFIIMGTFALTTQGIQGSIFQMVAHGISTGALFLLVGMIYERRHTREISALKGLQKVAPVMAGVFTLVMLSSIGLPGLNGFVGEFLILLGSFLTYRWWAVVAAAGVILAALYLLWAYQRVFHGEPDGANSEMPDMNWREFMVVSPLLLLIVFLGVYPKPMLDRMEPAVDELISHIEEHTDYVQPDVAVTGFAGDGDAAGADGAPEGEGG